MRQRTPPNSTGTSLSPLSSSYLSRLSSSNDNSPSRTVNTLRFTSPSTSLPNHHHHPTSTKQVDAVSLLLKQTLAPAQLTQVSNDDETSVKEKEKKKHSYCLSAISHFSSPLFTKVR